ncbi:peptidoglycan-binding protein [Lutibaculum baratangense]|uniref:Sel1 domain protein repeat-containing protein n=1 Tax=Lutibaculum baratangense AMV1 TaxID=631454 RepID=V4R3C5_9HYPH|nr:peptidoglycan-binding protein [Lutibaculum baratangense]ESR26417.1 Sel1 domain protein repeat-containing protein [Lutibaculum baratangense AMV1]
MSLGEWLDAVMREPEAGAAPTQDSGPERAGSEQMQAPEALRAIARRLDKLGGRIPGDTGSAEAARATVGELEQQLETMAQAVNASRPETAPNRSQLREGESAAGKKSIDGLRRAIDEIAARQKVLDRQGSGDTEPRGNRMQDLEAKIRALSGRLDRHQGLAAEMRSEFSRFGERLDTASETVAARVTDQLREDLRSRGRETQAEFDTVRAEMREVARDLNQARSKDAERLEADLARIGKRIEELQVSSPGIEQWMEDFAARLERATQEQLSALRSEMGEADRLVESLVKTEFEKLRAEFRQLSERIDEAGEKTPDLDARLDDLALRLDTATRSEVAALRNEIQEMGRSIERGARAEVQKLQSEFAALSERLGEAGQPDPAMEQRLGDLADRLGTATRGEMTALREEMQEIGRAVERSSRADLTQLEGQFTKLSGQIEEMGRRDPDLESRIEDLAVRLDTATKREIGELREEIRALAGQVDGGTKGELSSLKGEISKIADLLQIGAGGDSAEGREAAVAGLNAIREEIRGLQDRLDGNQEGYATLREEVRSLSERLSNQAPNRLDEMERRLNELADRIEANSGAIDLSALGRLETEVAGLTKALGEASDRPADISGVENAINELFDRIEEDRETAVAAARDAAEEAVRRALETLEARSAEGSISEALREELVSLRQHGDASEERTRSTLTAVHDTLQKIVERLTRLEAEVEEADLARGSVLAPPSEPEARPASQGAASSLYEPDQAADAATDDEIVGRIASVTRSFKNEIDDNTPLAPGSGRPVAASEDGASEAAPQATTAAAPSPSAEPRHTDPAAKPNDFIAAARRAAQTSTVETRGARLVPDADEDEARGARPLDLLKKYKRPLMIATAIIVIAVGAVQVVGFLRGGDLDLGATTDDRPALATLPPAAEGADVEAQVAGTEDASSFATRAAERTDPSEQAPEGIGAETVERGAELPGVAAVDPIETGSIAAPEEQASMRPGPEADMAAPAASKQMEIELPDPAVGPTALRLAAAQGDAAAQYEIGVRYTDGIGVARDASEAAKWYRLAAAQGLAPAQYRLGSLHEKGEGVEQDPDLARMWYQRAAEQGNSKAMHNLAVLYADGIKGTPDYERAAIWFRQAAEYGLSDSQYNLAILYARGMGVTQDLAESYKWFGIASAGGDGEAADRQRDVAKRLEPETVAELDRAVSEFKPKPLLASANEVPTPAGGWGEAEPSERTALDGATLIRMAQAKLAELGYDIGTVDGRIGPRTREAVRAFQTANGMEATGEIDSRLVARLQERTS